MGWESKLYMANERGVHKDIKKQNIFQICRGKFLTIFRENLERVHPCPSTWHKYETEILKIQNEILVSALLFLSRFFWPQWHYSKNSQSLEIDLDPVQSENVKLFRFHWIKSYFCLVDTYFIDACLVKTPSVYFLPNYSNISND